MRAERRRNEAVVFLQAFPVCACAPEGSACRCLKKRKNLQDVSSSAHQRQVCSEAGRAEFFLPVCVACCCLQANFGLVELKVRRWERLQRYVALVEAGAEEFPLDPLTAYTSSAASADGGGGYLAGHRMSGHLQQQRGGGGGGLEKDSGSAGSQGSPLSSGLVPGVVHLYYSELFHLKCSIVMHALDRLLASQSLLLHDQFFFNFLMRQYLPLLAKKKEPPSSEKFWRRVRSRTVPTRAQSFSVLSLGRWRVTAIRPSSKRLSRARNVMFGTARGSVMNFSRVHVHSCSTAQIPEYSKTSLRTRGTESEAFLSCSLTEEVFSAWGQTSEPEHLLFIPSSLRCSCAPSLFLLCTNTANSAALLLYYSPLLYIRVAWCIHGSM